MIDIIQESNESLTTNTSHKSSNYIEDIINHENNVNDVESDDSDIAPIMNIIDRNHKQTNKNRKNDTKRIKTKTNTKSSTAAKKHKCHFLLVFYVNKLYVTHNQITETHTVFT